MANKIATTNTNSKIVIWDALTTNKIKEVECKKGEVISMQYSPDGRFLATGMSIINSTYGILKLLPVFMKMMSQR
jgi:WD40 repeat protein